MQKTDGIALKEVTLHCETNSIYRLLAFGLCNGQLFHSQS